MLNYLQSRIVVEEACSLMSQVSCLLTRKVFLPAFSSPLLIVHAGNCLLAEEAVPGIALAFWNLFASHCCKSIVLK